MTAVFRHELSSYFTNVTGYVFGAFLLLFAGIYTMAINLQSASPYFEYVLMNMDFIFLIIVPILTMRVIAEERRQKTDQLLYSLPLTMTQVALGKYLAMLVIFLIPVAIIGVYPLVLTAFGDVYLPAAYGALVGFFFLGASLIAIGMFISSLTESQAVPPGCALWSWWSTTLSPAWQATCPPPPLPPSCASPCASCCWGSSSGP